MATFTPQQTSGVATTLQPIIGVRLHYFNDQSELQNRTVAYRHFGERHTATNITSAFEGILSEFSIDSQQLSLHALSSGKSYWFVLSLFDLKIWFFVRVTRSFSYHLFRIGSVITFLAPVFCFNGTFFFKFVVFPSSFWRG